MTKNARKNQRKDHKTESNPLVIQVRCILQQRLDEQVELLNADLFDEVDDFLFVGGQSGQLAGQENYLDVMREFRTRREMFEEQFLDALNSSLQTIFAPDAGEQLVKGADSNENDSVFERLEVDLALKNMRRKALKRYATLIKKLDKSDDDKVTTTSTAILETNDILVNPVIQALGDSIDIFNVSLEIKLVFLKLFDQHFLRKIEQLYEDLIELIHHQDEEEYVQDLYSAYSSSLDEEQGEKSRDDEESGPTNGATDVGKRRSGVIEENVVKVIEEVCSENELPEFMEKMIRQNWHNLLFLIGMNRGMDSSEWVEARATIDRLVDLVVHERSEVPDTNQVKKLRQQIRTGFDLIRLQRQEQDEFFSMLDKAIVGPAETQTVIEAASKPAEKAVRRIPNNDAAIGQAGRKILNDDDLDDIVALLSSMENVQTGIASNDPSDDSMSYFLGLVDELKDGEDVQFKKEEETQSCIFRKPENLENSYQITNRQGRVLLSRSRIGLALSVKSGEVKLRSQIQAQPFNAVSQQASLQTLTKCDAPTSH